MIGIDVSKDRLDCNFMDAATQKSRWVQAVPRTKQGVSSLLKKTPQGVPWVIEPTGHYSTEVAKLAQAAGQPVLMAPSRKAKAFLNSLPERAKTDKIDARGLALFGLTRAASVPLRPYPLKQPNVEHLDQLLSARRSLAKARAKLTQQLAQLPLAAEALREAITSLTDQIKKLDTQISACVRSGAEFAAARALVAVPGIGPVVSAAIASALSKGFQHPDQFVAYIGLDIRVQQSGQRKGELGLSHAGDAELRRLLYLAAQASLRSKDTTFKAQYDRELAKGLTKTGALCAVARKMAKLCWSMHRHGTEYDPTRVYKHPTPPRAQVALEAVPDTTSPSDPTEGA